MIAAWMLYCLLAALGLSIAAALAERALLAGRGPVRPVWIASVALSLLVPLVAYQFGQESVTNGAPGASVAGIEIPVAAVEATTTTILNPLPTVASDNPVNWRATLNQLDEPLLIVWAILSLALALNFVGSIIALAWMRRGWQPRELQNTSVFISRRTGPAVVGAISPAIVLPEWVLGLEPEQLTLMLQHEDEHRRARDGQLLTVARLALIVMPWNVALWWQILRLRVAVELDCDARVLQKADARTYGDLLLEVASARRGPSLIGATAFAERATQLERRIRVLPRHRVGTSRAARAIAFGVSLAAVTVAWAAPHPDIPAKASGRNSMPTPASLRSAVMQPTALPMPPAANKPASSLKSGNRANATSAQKPVRTDTIIRPATTQISGSVQIERVSDTVFALLFDGITLTRQNENAVRSLIDDVQTKQAADIGAFVQKRRDIQSRRDSALLTLLSSDGDRALLTSRIVPVQAPGSRGRSNGAPQQTNSVPPVGTAQNDIAGRGGRSGGGRGRGSSPDAIGANTDATFRRLFDGITLSPEQELTARTAINNAFVEMLSQPVPAPPPISVLSLSGTVLVRAPIDSSLLSFVTTEADRAKLQSRLVRPPQ